LFRLNSIEVNRASLQQQIKLERRATLPVMSLVGRPEVDPFDSRLVPSDGAAACARQLVKLFNCLVGVVFVSNSRSESVADARQTARIID